MTQNCWLTSVLPNQYPDEDGRSQRHITCKHYRNNACMFLFFKYNASIFTIIEKSMKTENGKKAGGLARAKALSPEARKQIASKGAAARWSSSLKRATHGSSEHPLKIGEIEIPCYVLEDGTRVLSQRGLQSGMGMSLSGGKAGEQRIATFLDSIEQKGIEINGLSARIRSPIKFKQPGGGRDTYGFEATILADICDVVLLARKNGVLQQQQMHIADQCEILVRGFARVGIIALIDEATGYQRDRAKDALSKILEAYVAKELQPWVHTFPSEFYEQLFRIRGLNFTTDSVKRPMYFGHLTNNIVYARLAPQVLEQLKKETPRDDAGRHKHHLHRKLTTDIGHPKLREHLASVITLMKISEKYDEFIQYLEKSHPKFNDTLALNFDGAEQETGI